VCVCACEGRGAHVHAWQQNEASGRVIVTRDNEGARDRAQTVAYGKPGTLKICLEFRIAVYSTLALTLSLAFHQKTPQPTTINRLPPIACLPARCLSVAILFINGISFPCGDTLYRTSMLEQYHTSGLVCVHSM